VQGNPYEIRGKAEGYGGRLPSCLNPRKTSRIKDAADRNKLRGGDLGNIRGREKNERKKGRQ